MKPNKISVQVEHQHTSYQMIDQVIHDCCKSIRYYANLIDQGNNDMDIIHQYRVSIRLTRSMLGLFKKQLDKKQHKQINQSLKLLAQHFARVREIDVIMQMYQDNKDIFSAQKDDLYRIIDDLQRDARMDALSTFDRKLTYLVIDQIKQIIISPQVISKLEQLNLEEFINQVIKKSMKKAVIAKKHISKTDDQTIHEYRLRLKKIRYAMQVFLPLIKLEYQHQLESLKQQSDDLGLICDVAVLHHVLEHVKDPQAQDVINSFLIYMEIKSKQIKHKYFNN